MLTSVTVDPKMRCMCASEAFTALGLILQYNLILLQCASGLACIQLTKRGDTMQPPSLIMIAQMHTHTHNVVVFYD